MSEPEVREEVTTTQKLRALGTVAKYRPLLTVSVIVLSFVAALLEGVGLSFLVPIIEQTQSTGSPTANPSGTLGPFVRAYDLLGIPFTLEFIIVGVAAVMVVRFTASFLVGWLRAAIETKYIRHLQTHLFDNTLDAHIGYFDDHGSDEILNTVVTQATYAGQAIYYVIQILEQGLISLVYLSIAMYLAPMLTIATLVLLGGVVFVIRRTLESGYDVGDRVADANERIQEVVQAGTQGIRDVKLFGMGEELFSTFQRAVQQFHDSTITLRRNEAAIDSLYQLTVAVSVFALIYFAVTFSSLSLSGLGVFLFAMFRLGPRVSTLNNYLYTAEGKLPHLVRTQRYVADLEAHDESTPTTEQLPETVRRIWFDDVSFSYDPNDPVICDLSFEVSRGEFIAFVGPSGAGKSTIVSLLSRMYDPSEGAILADGIDIDAVDIGEWRSRVSVVRQDPYIFNDTLRYNVTVGNRDVTEAELKEACEVAQVTEFLDDLPNGYDSELGDDGVRLSGGQRQRIAIARTLLEGADLLIFDEATSDLDTALERKVHAAIEAMERDYAMIVIAHRLSTVTNADRINAMEDGRITERGTHEELLERGGQYSTLYSIQT